ncbi:MAG TPA: hypothetical protein VML75_02450 [Kofleriaceae bacterium]|nr:hypothetical protein [Kofleriaceae bacterium]
MFLRLLCCVLFFGLTAAGCAAKAPQLKVLGVGQADSRDDGARGRMLVVYVEVVNRTNRDLELSKLEYTVAAESWFSSEGAVRLSRVVGPNATAVVEIPVPFKPRADAPMGVAYSLRGKLFAQDSQIERSWSISSDGTLDPAAIAVAPDPQIRARVATGQ